MSSGGRDKALAADVAATAREGTAMGRRILLTLVALVVSAVVLRWLLSEAVIAAFAEALRRAHLWRLVAAWALVPIIQGLRACRFSLLATGRPATAFWVMYAITARLLLFNYLLPFKLGELSFPLMMKRAFGSHYLRSAGVLILARLMDLCVVGAIFALGAALLIDPVARPWNLWLLLAMGAAALALPIAGIELLGPLWRLGARLLRLAPRFDRPLWGELLAHPRSERVEALLLTLAIWTTHATLAYVAATAVADGFSFFQVVLADVAANLAFAVPVSGLAGLGPPQAAWATVLHLSGVAWEPAIVTALVCHGILLSGALLVGMTTFVLPEWRAPLHRGTESG
jgi:uncharacterized membrane protein YbhN (UPF0104 family)